MLWIVNIHILLLTTGRTIANKNTKGLILDSSVLGVEQYMFNPLIAGAANIRVFIFYYHIKYHILNILKIKCDINQQDLKRVDLHFVKSE